MNTFELGDRVTITGIVEKTRDHSIWRPKDSQRIASEVAALWPEIREQDGRAEFGLLRTRWMPAPAPADSGVIVGKRTVQEGITESYYDGDPPCFMPGATVTVYLVAYNLHRKPITCLPAQLRKGNTP